MTNKNVEKFLKKFSYIPNSSTVYVKFLSRRYGRFVGESKCRDRYYNIEKYLIVDVSLNEKRIIQLATHWDEDNMLIENSYLGWSCVGLGFFQEKLRKGDI